MTYAFWRCTPIMPKGDGVFFWVLPPWKLTCPLERDHVERKGKRLPSIISQGRTLELWVMVLTGGSFFFLNGHVTWIVKKIHYIIIYIVYKQALLQKTFRTRCRNWISKLEDSWKKQDTFRLKLILVGLKNPPLLFVRVDLWGVEGSNFFSGVYLVPFFQN